LTNSLGKDVELLWWKPLLGIVIQSNIIPESFLLRFVASFDDW